MTTMADNLQREVSKTSSGSKDIEVNKIDQESLSKGSAKNPGATNGDTALGDGNQTNVKIIRPPIVYDSPGNFFRSVRRCDRSYWLFC